MVLLTIDEAAERLHATPRFIRRLVAERRITYTKIGKFVRIPAAEVDRFIAAGLDDRFQALSGRRRVVSA